MSDPRAGRRASPGCFGLQLLPEPAASLDTHKGKDLDVTSATTGAKRDTPEATTLPEVHTSCCCISQTQPCHQKPIFGYLRKQSHGQHSQVGCPLLPLAETTALILERGTQHHGHALCYTFRHIFPHYIKTQEIYFLSKYVF